MLGVESLDFSQAEKERTACKAGQIHKMTCRGPMFSTAGKSNIIFP